MAARVLAALAMVVWLAGGAAAHAPAQPTFRSGVTLLTIDVAVLDGDWRPRPGLTAADVEVEGRRQAVKTLDNLDVAATGPSRADVLATLRADAAAARPAPDVASLLEPRAIVAHLASVPGAAPAGSVPAADLPAPEFFAALARYAAGASGARADVARGLAALHRQDWAAAVAALEQALDTAPDALVALRYLGAASAGIGEDRDAAGAWALSLTGADASPAWLLAHAHALVRAQDLPGALAVLTDGVARWPADAALLARRGELLIAAGRSAESRADLEAAVDRAPGHDRALFLLTVLSFADVAGGAGAGAVAAFDRWSARYLARPGAPPSPVAEWRRLVLGRAPR